MKGDEAGYYKYIKANIHIGDVNWLRFAGCLRALI